MKTTTESIVLDAKDLETMAYVSAATSDTLNPVIPFHLLGADYDFGNGIYLMTIQEIKAYLIKASTRFDGHFYYTKAGQTIRDIVTGNLPDEELAITILHNDSCLHIGDELISNTPMRTGWRAVKIADWQTNVMRILASYIAMVYPNTKVDYNGLDIAYGGFILRVQK